MQQFEGHDSFYGLLKMESDVFEWRLEIKVLVVGV